MFDFGKRRIRAINYTHYVALPKDWLRFHNLDMGDYVLVELAEGGDLLLTPVKKEVQHGEQK